MRRFLRKPPVAFSRFNVNLTRRSIATSEIWGEVLDGKLTKNEEYAANDKSMDGIVSHFQQTLSKAMEAGGTKAIAKHKARGKLLARERIDNLVDPGSPFLGERNNRIFEIITLLYISFS